MIASGPSDETAAFDALVARTAGLQPWRKVFHAFNAVAVAVFVTSVDPPRSVLLSLLGALVAVLLVADLARLRSARLNDLFFRAFVLLASPREARGIASSTWYAIGILAAFALFPRDVAVSSVLVMGLADPAASYVGRRFGRKAFLGGTAEGTLTFLAVAAVVMLARHAAPAALLAAAASALVERRCWPLDDNLAVPLACGIGLLVGGWLS
jgi:dolichol kinase